MAERGWLRLTRRPSRGACALLTLTISAGSLLTLLVETHRLRRLADILARLLIPVIAELLVNVLIISLWSLVALVLSLILQRPRRYFRAWVAKSLIAYAEDGFVRMFLWYVILVVLAAAENAASQFYMLVF